MQLEELAHAVLFGSRWEDKLITAEKLQDSPKRAVLQHAPSFPGRPAHLSRLGRAEFPSDAKLAEASHRGRLLHFFANHELLAMELMALMLLKFPDAAKPFRAGIAETIREEQNHLRLYVERMNELGVGFGELPVNEYFWKAMKDMTSPLQFVVQMSLTFEQANLDFSLYFQKAVAKAGDEKTAAILERVYREEIGHVKHGLIWFNRWRSEAAPPRGEDDWDAYLRLLGPPMTARRAKGPVYSAEARRLAGFSERYIHELEVFTGSKGRPPVYWFFNPLCEAEIARGKPGFTPPDSLKDIEQDLSTVPMFLALESDVLFVAELPRAEWLKPLQDLGFSNPEFRLPARSGETPRENKIAGLEPWGWSPETFERFRSAGDRLIPIESANGAWATTLLKKANFAETGLASLYSKVWSTGFLRAWLTNHPEDQALFGIPDIVGETFTDWKQAKTRLSEALAASESLLAKAPLGTSGTQNKRVLKAEELDSTLGAWIENTIEAQGAIILEQWLDKTVDLSLQIAVGPQVTRQLGVRHFVNGSRLEYRGTHLDLKLRSLPTDVLRFLNSSGAPLERWRVFADALGATLRSLGYQGPAGLDAMVWKAEDGGYRLKPLVELNPRWTMGRVAIALESYALPGTPAAWLFLPVKGLKRLGLPLNPADAAAELTQRHPPRLELTGTSPRLAEGVVFTTDPDRARKTLTALVVGRKALSDPSLQL